MQVASAYPSSLHHSHYHTYYQLHTPGPQDHELKRQYLALLPPQQIIEICLTFDAYVSPYVRSTIWPLDLTSAIAALQKARSTTSDATEKSSLESSKKDGVVAVMDSLNPPDEKEDTPAPPENTSRTEPQPPDKDKSWTLGPPSTSTASVPAPLISSTSSTQPAENASPTASTLTASAPSAESTTSAQGTAAPTPAPAPTPQPVPTHPHPHPHPHPAYPYGYGHPPAAYPHTPYYATGYPYPYTYPTTQNGYHHPPQPPPPPPHAQPPTYAVPQTSMYSSMVPLPPPKDGVSADDLPSYEEMLVEALTDCTEPDGLAPKDLFAWMASRYPVQSNFRPSASQALQKAFRRGRFEKSSNGRYRLNATWEGGNTSRRTTRRPQIHSGLPPAATTTGGSTPIPPFTHAPLVHHHHGHSTSSSTQYPYGYPHPGYAGFGAHPASSAAGASSTASKTIPTGTSDGPTADAYEAAQNILKAINFGGLLSMPPDDDQHHNEPQAKDDQAQEVVSIANGVENLLSHVQAVLAANTAGAEAQGAVGATGGAAGAMVPAISTPPADPRAELQAQLALLSAQLVELEQLERGPDAVLAGGVQPLAITPPGTSSTPLALPGPLALPASSSAVPAATESTPVSTNIVAPAPVVPAMATLVPDAPQSTLPVSVPTPAQDMLPLEALPEEDEESDDDDMEEVI